MLSRASAACGQEPAQHVAKSLRSMWPRASTAYCQESVPSAGRALAHRHRHHGVLPGHSRAVHLAGLQDLDILRHMDRPGWPPCDRPDLQQTRQ